MNDAEVVHAITLALEDLARDLDVLRNVGGGIPAVERNARRMGGTLRQLEVQFAALAAAVPPFDLR